MNEKCEFCNGTGQVSFFQGVSRFLLTTEDCPHCGGTGISPEPAEKSGKKSKRKK